MIFIGESPVRKSRAKERGLKTWNSIVRDKFTRLCERKYRSQKILEKIHENFKIVKAPTNVEIKRKISKY